MKRRRRGFRARQVAWKMKTNLHENGKSSSKYKKVETIQNKLCIISSTTVEIIVLFRTIAQWVQQVAEIIPKSHFRICTPFEEWFHGNFCNINASYTKLYYWIYIAKVATLNILSHPHHISPLSRTMAEKKSSSGNWWHFPAVCDIICALHHHHHHQARPPTERREQDIHGVGFR